MRIKVPLLSTDPSTKLNHDEFVVAKALGILPEVGKNYIELEINDEQLKNLSLSIKAPLEELLKIFLARFGFCLWTAILISIGGSQTKAPLTAIEEELNHLRQRLTAITNEELSKQAPEL